MPSWYAMNSDYISQPDTEWLLQQECADQLRVTVHTIYRWRTEGRLVIRAGRKELIILKSIKTSGINGDVRTPLDFEQNQRGRRVLGWMQFIIALGADPVLQRDTGPIRF